MIQAKRVDQNSIEISIEGALKRLPNQLIWEINTLLLTQYDKLFEVFFSKHDRSISENIINCGETLFLEELDPVFIRRDPYDEKECLANFQELRGQIESYEEFFEAYFMPAVNELHYVAVPDMQAFLSRLKESLESKDLLRKKTFLKYLRERSILEIIAGLVPMYATIADHVFLGINLQDEQLADKVFAIAKNYASAM